MFITGRSLPRRTFLRGLGASVAIPLLDAMVPAARASAAFDGSAVRRFGVVYVPNGMNMEQWTPRATGATFEMTSILQPLTPMRDRVLVVSGLNGAKSKGSHSGAATRFLTGFGADSTQGSLISSTSIDQILARDFGRRTQLPSLELSLDGRDEAGSCDANPCAMSNTISWHNASVPIPMENNPRAVFERLFGDVDSTDAHARAARLDHDRSILDSVLQSASALASTLGVNDRRRLDEYLDGVREIEARIQKAEAQTAVGMPVVAPPSGIPASFDEYAMLMFDLQVLAYQADLTRVITFMMGREFSGRSYADIGVADAHHPLSHHQYDPLKLAALARINAYHLSLFTRYIDKLRQTSDGNGSLFDHTLMMYGAGMSDSNAHDPNNLPILLAGGADLLRGGRHVNYAGEPSANLLVAIVDKLGVYVDRVGTSTGELAVEGLEGI